MRTLTWSAVLVVALGSPLTLAAEPVRVLDARPYFEETRSLQHEWRCDERRTPLLSRDRRAQLFGGLAGGYLGSQIGSGRGRDVATVAGALYGAELARQHFGGPAEGHCRQVATPVIEQRIGGYDVIYERDGRLWRTRLADDPGPTLDVPRRGEGTRRR